MAYAGIDYSLGQSNVDKTTGIHYGVISQNSVMSEVMDDVEYDYGKPTCPKCGNEAIEQAGAGIEVTDEWDIDGNEYACEACKYAFESYDAFSEEPLGWSYDREGYQLADCLNNDIFVLKSPYYTFAQFCSPCVPGAGNLDTYVENGVKTYALGHDWFDGGKAPYPVYSVKTGEEVPEEEENEN